MPQADNVLRIKWAGPDDTKALNHLLEAGYVMTEWWTWVVPAGREPTDDDMSAVQFLIDEWDFDGLEP